MRIDRCSIALLLSASAAFSQSNTVLDFEAPFPAGLTPVPLGTLSAGAASITNQYADRGVVMANAAVVVDSRVVSGTHAIIGINSNGILDANAPMTFRFVAADRTSPATTEYFAITTDPFSGEGPPSVTVSGFAPDGQLLGKTTQIDTGRVTLVLQGIGKMQTVVVQPNVPNPGNGAITFDLLTFGPLTAVSGPVTRILPQFAFGGGWYSAVYFTNTGASAVSFPVNFVADNGTPLSVPSLGTTSAMVNLAPRGTAIIEAPNVGPLNQGYVSSPLPGGVIGYGVFRQSISGRGDQEAVVPLSGVSSTTSTLVWDDTNFTTAVAIVNPSSLDTTVTIVVRDESGTTIGTSALSLAAKSKRSAALRDLPGLGAIAGKRGSADFTVAFGNVAVLGLRFGGAAFTSIPTGDK